MKVDFHIPVNPIPCDECKSIMEKGIEVDIALFPEAHTTVFLCKKCAQVLFLKIGDLLK